MAKFKAYTGRDELANLTFEWEISELEKKIETVKVDEFLGLDDVNVGESKWFFRFYPNGEKNNTTKETAAIRCYSKNKEPKTANVSISVIENMENSSSISIYKKQVFKHTFQALDGKIFGYGFHNFLTHQELKDNARILSNGGLRLLIKMTVFGEEKTTRKPINYDSQDMGTIEIQERLKVSERIKDKWINDNFSDVHIKCGGQIFYCHRMILASGSQYFSSMLDRWMESGQVEGEIRGINLEHMDVDVLKAILKFIYGGKIEKLETNAVDLLKAAGMLIMEDLKNICEKYLLSNYMKLENVIDVVVMAEAHNAGHLKKAALEMIVANSEDIVKQDGWKEKLALANSPMLVIEIFEAMAANKAL